MCKRQIYYVRAEPVLDILFELCKDPRDDWVVNEMVWRNTFGIGKDQYRMYVKVDLTEALPWIRGPCAAIAQALRGAGGRIIGIYNPDTHMWMLCIGGRRIDIPELLNQDEERQDDDEDTDSDDEEDDDNDTDSDDGEDDDDDVTESEDEGDDGDGNGDDNIDMDQDDN